MYPIQQYSDFIWDFGKLPFPTHLIKYFFKIGKIRAKIHEIGKIKAIFGLGMTPIYGLKNGQIKSLQYQAFNDILCYKLFFYTYVCIIEIFIQKKYICVYDQMMLSFNYTMLGNIGKLTYHD